jgi:hypothetical protein
MIKPEIPENESERLHALRTLQILDTTHEERFDRVTRMAKRIFGVSISLVSLIDQDRQWFKSKQGFVYLLYQTRVKTNDFLIIH